MEFLKLEDLDDDFYLQMDKEFLRKLLKKTSQRGGGVHHVLGTPDSNVSRMRKTGITSAKHLRLLIQFRKIEATSTYDKIYSIKVGDRGILVPIKLPLQYSPQLAALVGHVMGDGTITKTNCAFGYANKDKGLILKVKSLVEKVFRCTTCKEYSTVKKNGPIYTLAFPSVVGLCLKKAGAPQGKKVEQFFDVPLWIKNGDHKTKSAFLRALFDDDGSIEKQGMLTFTNSKRKHLREQHEAYLNSIRSLLAEFEIESHVRYVDRGDSYKADIRITNLQNLERFEQHISFDQSRRKARLAYILKNPRRSYSQFGEGKNIIYRLIDKSPTALTTEEISEKIKRNFSMTRTYLFRLEKERKIERVFPQRHKVRTLWKCKGRTCKIPEIDSLYSIPLILQNGPKTMTELSAILKCNKGTVRRNLGLLKKQKIVSGPKRGRLETLWRITS